MEKTTGLHLYINVSNIGEIIKGEENKNDELKRSIHRLHTYFEGVTKVVNHFDADVEKFTYGRAHIYIEQLEDESDADFNQRILDLIVALFKFGYDVFNEINKYSSYTKFKFQAGADYDEFYKHDIDGMDEFTTIGTVANVAAKLTSFAGNKAIYITDNAGKKLPKDEKGHFTLLDEDELKEVQEKLKGNPLIYSATYTDLTVSEKVTKLMESLKDECDKTANSLNLVDMTFEDAKSKINFSRLSRKKNKQITAGILYGDLRGFTKLFNVSGNNLDNLALVLKEVYKEFDAAVTEKDGVRVQFQGDRIVAIFNSFTDELELDIVRMFEASLVLKDKINALSDTYSEQLGNKKLKIGIGLCYGEYYATRLGLRSYTDNIVLGSTAAKGDTAEDKYAEDQDIAVTKEFKNKIDELKDESTKSQVIANCLDAISTTGFYKTSISQSDFDTKVTEQEKLNKRAAYASVNILTASHVKAVDGIERTVRPHGNPIRKYRR